MSHAHKEPKCLLNEMAYSGTDAERLINEYVNGLRAERNREILKSKYIDGKTFEELAEQFDMSVSQIGRIVRRYGNPIILALSEKR